LGPDLLYVRLLTTSHQEEGSFDVELYGSKSPHLPACMGDTHGHMQSCHVRMASTPVCAHKCTTAACHSPQLMNCQLVHCDYGHLMQSLHLPRLAGGPMERHCSRRSDRWLPAAAVWAQERSQECCLWWLPAGGYLVVVFIVFIRSIHKQFLWPVPVHQPCTAGDLNQQLEHACLHCK
jgi:hypothetical protein